MLNQLNLLSTIYILDHQPTVYKHTDWVDHPDLLVIGEVPLTQLECDLLIAHTNLESLDIIKPNIQKTKNPPIIEFNPFYFKNNHYLLICVLK